MAVNRSNRTPAPIYGIRPGFNISDLPHAYDVGVVALNGVTIATTSNALDLGARAIHVDLTCVDGTTTFDLKVYTNADAYAAPVFTATGLKHGADVYVGGFEGVDLAGQPIKVRVENLSAANAVTAIVKVNA